MVPVAVLVLPFVLNVALCVFLDRGPALTPYLRHATDENVVLFALVVYSVWLVHSVTFAVLLPNPRTQSTQAAALAHSLGRWWTTEWALLTIAHLLCKTAFNFNQQVASMLTVFDGLVIAILLSKLTRPSSFPQLATLAILGLAVLQCQHFSPTTSLNDMVTMMYMNADVTFPLLTATGIFTLLISYLIDQSASPARAAVQNGGGVLKRAFNPKTSTAFEVPVQPIAAPFGCNTSLVLARTNPDQFLQEGFQAEDIELDFAQAQVTDIAHTILSDGGLFLSFKPQETGTLFCTVYVNNAALEGCPFAISVE